MPIFRPFSGGQYPPKSPKSESNKPQNDRIGLKEAIGIIGLKQSSIYKMTMTGTIPYEKFGKRLVFSRKQLEEWVQQRTVRKQSPEENASQQLAKVTRKKLR
jgi:excisionase family DNA binding protein